MKCAIMQPTYFPWAGYFNLISQVNHFVFLDDAQFQKGSWHNRNKFMVHGAATWMTIPVLHNFLGQSLLQSQIDDQKPWRRKHVNLITLNYSKHEYFEVVKPIIEIIQDNSLQLLASLNIKIIKEICIILNLKPYFTLASALKVTGTRSEKLIKICNKLNCSEYISPEGATHYLQQDGFTNISDIKLTINKFEPKPYPQLKSKAFISYLSIIDVLANIGQNKSIEYILK